MATSGESDIDLLLVGKTGNGKSATGNSILGKRAFVSKGSSTSVTTDVKRDTSVINGKKISVTDIPGLEDTTHMHNKENNFEMAKDAVKEAVEMLRGGFSAILVVLRFGCRFTAEDKETIKIIKSILGYSVVEEHCICLFTCGDNFEHELENEEFKTFDEWCGQQTGDLRTLLDKCLYRCVLFDNRTKDPAKIRAQRDRLMSIVEDMRTRQRTKFGLKEFQLATQEHELRMIVERIPELEREGKMLTAEIRIEREQIKRGENVESRHSQFQALLSRLESHRKRLEEYDAGTDILSDLIFYVTREESRVLSDMQETSRRRRHRHGHPRRH